MGAIESVLNILLIYLIVSSLFKIFTIRKAKQKAQVLAKNQQAMEAMAAKEKEVPAVEMVTDPVCGGRVPKTQAQILVRDGQRHYFCSWDCREKFAAEKRADRILGEAVQ